MKGHPVGTLVREDHPVDDHFPGSSVWLRIVRWVPRVGSLGGWLCVTSAAPGNVLCEEWDGDLREGAKFEDMPVVGAIPGSDAERARVTEPTDLDPCYGNPVERCTNPGHVKRGHEALFAAEADHWQKRHAALAERVGMAVGALGGRLHIGDPDNVERPEPPVGTTFTLAESGRLVWQHQDDGWHCPAVDCRNCPAAWGEVCDHAGGIDDLVRHLPGGDEA